MSSDRLVHLISHALKHAPDTLPSLIEHAHEADIADVIEKLHPDQRQHFFQETAKYLSPGILAHLHEDVREEVLPYMDIKRVIEAVQTIDRDMAIDVLEDLSEPQQAQVLNLIQGIEQENLRTALTYPKDSAGRLMARQIVALPQDWTAGHAHDYLQRHKDDLPDHLYQVYLIDADKKPTGVINLSKIFIAKRTESLLSLAEPTFHKVLVLDDQEDVAFLFRQYDLSSVAVVDADGRLAGTITVDDIIDVIEEEAQEDLLRLSRVSHLDLHKSLFQTAMARSRWLFVTFINTILASSVIYHFQPTIEKLVALAVLMPIVAAMGGNAGMQVVTVAVRAIATRELSAVNMGRILRKELLIALINSIIFGSLMTMITTAVFGNLQLGLILGCALVFNTVWAAFVGILFPMGVNRLGFDPAISAGPLLTTTTDVLGFLVFLSLATMFLF